METEIAQRAITELAKCVVCTLRPLALRVTRERLACDRGKGLDQRDDDLAEGE